jgi:hypothetical protein
MKRFSHGEKVKEIGHKQALTVIETLESDIFGNTVMFYWVDNGIEHYGELPESELTEFNPIIDYSKNEHE